jgi:hypothetical protein
MSDRWAGWLEIEHVPPAWIVTKRDGPDAYLSLELNTSVVPRHIAESIDGLGFTTMAYWPDGTDGGCLRLEAEELTDGSVQFFRFSRLPDELIEAQLPFRAGDDGNYGVPGTRWWWAPGMDAVAKRVATGDHGIVLTYGEAVALWPNETLTVARQLIVPSSGDEAASAVTAANAGAPRGARRGRVSPPVLALQRELARRGRGRLTPDGVVRGGASRRGPSPAW